MHFFKPVRDAVGDNDYVSFADLARFAAVNFLATKFVRGDGFGFRCLAAGNEHGGPFEEIKNIGIASVDLRYSGRVATARVNFEIVCLDERHAFGKSSGHFVALEEYDGFVLDIRLLSRGKGDDRYREDDEGLERHSYFEHGRSVACAGGVVRVD